MTEAEIQKLVVEIICDQFGIYESDFSLDDEFRGQKIAADSLDAVELVMEFEDEFNVSIPDEDEEKLLTPRHVIKYISEHTSNMT